MIKIKFECWWTDTPSINNRILKQFILQEDLSKYSLVNQDPDFTIVLGRTEWDKIETPKERTFYVSQEPLWSPNQPKDGIHNYCSKIIISDKRDYPDREEYIETLLPMLYSGRGEMDHREEWDWSTKIKDKEFYKDQIISIIVKNDHYSHYNHLVNPITGTINYGLRTDLGLRLSQEDKVDIYGNNWVGNSKNIKGEIWNKHLGLDNYHFSIGCENTIQKNYISEKFWDIVLTNTIPIYLGCSNISNYIPENCFIYLNNMTMDEMVIKINDVFDNYLDYQNFFYKNIIKLKQDFFSNPTYNLWEKVKELTNA